MQAPPNSRVQAFEANAAGAWFRQDPSGLAPQVPVPLHKTSKFHSASIVHCRVNRKHPLPLEERPWESRATPHGADRQAADQVLNEYPFETSRSKVVWTFFAISSALILPARPAWRPSWKARVISGGQNQSR